MALGRFGHPSMTVARSGSDWEELPETAPDSAPPCLGGFPKCLLGLVVTESGSSPVRLWGKRGYFVKEAREAGTALKNHGSERSGLSKSC